MKVKEWDEDVSINWWKDGRTKLNKVIRKYNKWVDRHTENKVKTVKLLNEINDNLDMYYCNRDGGSAWKYELIEMKNVVVEHLLNDIE